METVIVEIIISIIIFELSQQQMKISSYITAFGSVSHISHTTTTTVGVGPMARRSTMSTGWSTSQAIPNGNNAYRHILIRAVAITMSAIIMKMDGLTMFAMNKSNQDIGSARFVKRSR